MNNPTEEALDAFYGFWMNPQQGMYLGLSADPSGALAARWGGMAGEMSTGSLPTVIVEEVSFLHLIGQYRAASDRLLAFVDHWVETLDYSSLELLLNAYIEKIRAGEEQLASDQGQARLINVLAMTSGKPLENQLREQLRSEFLDFLTARSGRAYAEKLLGNL
jgi:hypothetical protein